MGRSIRLNEECGGGGGGKEVTKGAAQVHKTLTFLTLRMCIYLIF